MAFMKFYVGNEANASSHRDGIYIAIDTKKIFYNGDAYGGGDVDLNNYVTLDGEQTITGRKTFNDCIIVKHTPSAENGNTAFSISKPNTSGGFKVELVRNSSSVSSAKVTIHNGTNALDWNNAALKIISGLDSNGSSYGVRITYGGILVEGDPNSSDDRDMIINHEGITISGKTTSDLLNAGGGTISIDELKSQLNIPDTSALQGAIGTNVYTGANYISKETNLTEAVLQLDEEIKATNDNLALEHTNAEATYAKKTELGKKLDISTYTSDKATFALKSEIPDVSNFLTISNAQSTYLTKMDARNTYQPKGNYLTAIPSEYVTDSELNAKGYQTEAQVAAKVASLVDSAPETLDTLNELAAALGDDPNFATTVTNQIASKQDKLVSGTNIKTINGQTLLGSGDITTPTPTVNAASGTKTIWTGTSSEYEAVSPKDANTLYFITEE